MLLTMKSSSAFGTVYKIQLNIFNSHIDEIAAKDIVEIATLDTGS
jgi:hypothetical protein